MNTDNTDSKTSTNETSFSSSSSSTKIPSPPPIPTKLMNDTQEVSNKQNELLLKEEHDDKKCGSSYGICKWFSDKSGYGFITVLSEQNNGKEVFVHYTGIKPMNSSYKTLLSGEYISFDIVQGLKDLQAVNVLGINGGPFMCDTNPNIKYITPKIKPIADEANKEDNKEDNKEENAYVQKTVIEGIIGHYYGICKWFNDVSGYGFLVIETGDNAGKNVFVHYSGISPLTSHYKSLVSGEYVSFDTIKGTKGLQAVNVTGFNGGPLMCDINHIPKTSSQPKTNDDKDNTPFVPVVSGRSGRSGHERGNGFEGFGGRGGRGGQGGGRSNGFGGRNGGGRGQDSRIERPPRN